MLLYFLADLFRSEEVQQELVVDPQGVFERYGLTEDQIRHIRTAQLQGLGRVLEGEVCDRIGDMLERNCYPGEIVTLDEIEPAEVPAGQTVRVTAQGTGFAPQSEISFDAGGQAVQAEATAVSGGAMELTLRFDEPGLYDATVRNEDDWSRLPRAIRVV